LEARKKGKKQQRKETLKKERIHTFPGESLGSSRNSGVGKAIGGFASVAETMVDFLRFSPGFL
jgi:hypothetical protein